MISIVWKAWVAICNTLKNDTNALKTPIEVSHWMHSFDLKASHIVLNVTYTSLGVFKALVSFFKVLHIATHAFQTIDIILQTNEFHCIFNSNFESPINTEPGTKSKTIRFSQLLCWTSFILFILKKLTTVGKIPRKTLNICRRALLEEWGWSPASPDSGSFANFFLWRGFWLTSPPLAIPDYTVSYSSWF